MVNSSWIPSYQESKKRRERERRGGGPSPTPSPCGLISHHAQKGKKMGVQKGTMRGTAKLLVSSTLAHQIRFRRYKFHRLLMCL